MGERMMDTAVKAHIASLEQTKEFDMGSFRYEIESFDFVNRMEMKYTVPKSETESNKLTMDVEMIFADFTLFDEKV